MNNLINSKLSKNNSYIQNNNSGSILNNNIFNNKLLLNFTQKEKDINFNSDKYIQKNQTKQKEEQNNSENNMNNIGSKNNLSEKENKTKINFDIIKRNDYNELFKLNDITSDKKANNTIKTDKTLSQLKENESNLYKEEILKEEEDNFFDEEELRQKFKLKEVILKFVLNDDEYRLLIEEKARSINPFDD